MINKLFKVGDIVRYGGGSTALMEIESIYPNYGGSVAYYQGLHCMGGSHFAYHEKIEMASKEDLRQWKDSEDWRTK